MDGPLIDIILFQVASGETGPQDQVCDAKNVRIADGECDGESFKDWTSLGIVFLGIFLLGIGISFYFSFDSLSMIL